MAAMLDGRNIEHILHCKEHFFPYEKNNLLFLPCNVAAVQRKPLQSHLCLANGK